MSDQRANYFPSEFGSIATQSISGKVCEAAVRASDVPVALQELAAMADDLDKISLALADRLGAVLQPQGNLGQGTKTAGEPPQPVRAPLANRLHEIRARLGASLATLHNINSRIEL